MQRKLTTNQYSTVAYADPTTCRASAGDTYRYFTYRAEYFPCLLLCNLVHFTLNFLIMAPPSDPDSPSPFMVRLEAKMDMMLRRMDEFTAMQEKMVMLETTVGALNETVATLYREVAELKDKSNARDQQARGLSLRLYGLDLGEEEDNSAESGRALLKRVYDHIVKPVLASAKANKQLEALPNLGNAVTEAYRVRGGATKQPSIPGQPVKPLLPPPLIIKFASAHVRMAFLKNKKASLPPPTVSEKASGVKKYVVVEDLTAPTYKKLREMLDSGRVDKVWAMDGRLRFTVPGDKIVRKVKSVFSSVDEILSG